MYKQQREGIAPLKVFISYAREDEALCEKLREHLSLLQYQEIIAIWYDRQIMLGTEWSHEIDHHLHIASLILLLISPDFLASKHCYEIEMQTALQRHQRGKVCVIPIILRPCDWHSAPFGQLQCLPRDGRPVTMWGNQDEAFQDIARGIRQATQQRNFSTPAVAPLSPLDRQNRLRLLARVRRLWIKGVLEHSLHQATLIALDLQEQPDALANPWHLAVQETNLPPRALPSGTSIVEIYEQAAGELLLLGEPGAGKTTLLLELARVLLDRAEQEESHRLPVVFNLSGWANRRLPLRKWHVEELHSKYQVPRRLGQAWIDADQILPLLDGLDEVAQQARSACVQAINAYYNQRSEQGPAPLVVSCRSQEYRALLTRINLPQAVSIQPLTDDQIRLYLQSARDQLEALHYALYADSDLYNLARCPLMLSIFMLAYREAGLQDLPTKGIPETRPREVFATYVRRMLDRRGASRHLSHEQALRWLKFLATQMQQRYQTIFYLEGLQPDWLKGWRSHLLYRLSSGLLFGVFFGVFFGLLGGLVRERIELLVYGLPNRQFLNGLFVGLASGLIFGLVGGLTRLIPREVLGWSWRRAGWGIVVGLVVVLVVMLVVGLGGWLLLGNLDLLDLLSLLLVGGPPTGLTFGLVNGLLSELPSNQLDKRMRLKPNQGVWRSARNGLLVMLAGWLLGGLLAGLLAGLFVGLNGGGLIDRLYNGTIAGLFFGLIAGPGSGMVGGLGAFLQHFTLRFWLWRTGCLPWNVGAFMDEAAERLLMSKVGGGYIFVHRLLLEHFASQDTAPPFQQKQVQVKPHEKSGQSSLIIPPAMRLPARK